MAKHSLATRNKISLAQKGKHNSMYGRHHSEKTLEKLSRDRSGKKNPMYGRHHSEETIKKIKLAIRRRKYR